MKKVIIINNVIAPYRIPLFNEIYELLKLKKIPMEVLFLSKKESIRKWSIEYNKIKFNYKILPVIYQKRNINTTTSDQIINTGYIKYMFASRVLLFGYNYFTYFIIIIFRKLILKKTFLFSESTFRDKLRTKGIKFFLKSFFLKYCFSAILVPGLEAKKFIISHGVSNKKILIATNAVNPPNREVSEIKFNKKKITLLYVGRLAKEKNIDFIIKSIPHKSFYNYKLIIVGTGDRLGYLKRLKVSYPIEFRGFEEGKKLAQTYQESDIIILASISETWGFVINEALSYGVIPIVSENVGCRHELVSGNGEIFKLNNKLNFQSKLQLVSENLKKYKNNSLKKSKKITIQHQARAICKKIIND